MRLTSHSLQGSPSLGYGPGEGPEGQVGQQALAFEFSVRCSVSWVLGGCQSFCQFSRGRWSSGRSTNHCSIWGQLLRLGNSHPHFCQPLQRDDHNPHLCSHVCVIPHSLLWSHFGSPLQCVGFRTLWSKCGPRARGSVDLKLEDSLAAAELRFPPKKTSKI